MLLIMFARLFLGVHTLFDVLTGAALAVIIMVLNWILISFSYSSDGAYLRISVLYFLLFMVVLVPWILIAEDTGPITSYGGIMLGAVIGRQMERSCIGYVPHDRGRWEVIRGLIIGWLIAGTMVAVPYLTLDPQLGMMLGGFLGAIGIFTVVPYVLMMSYKPTLSDR